MEVTKTDEDVSSPPPAFVVQPPGVEEPGLIRGKREEAERTSCSRNVKEMGQWT